MDPYLNSQIIFQGENIQEYNRKQWEAYRGPKCSICFQDALTALNPTMTVGKQIMEKIRVHKKVSKQEAWAEAVQMLERVGIPNPELRMKQYPHEFSGGMRQRVMIAIAMTLNPDLLIADEPTTALDVTVQADILDMMKEIQKEHPMSIILITHDLGIVANFATDIIVMYAGKIVERGTSEDIFYHPTHPYTKALLSAVPIPDPEIEKKKKLLIYDPTLHDYTISKPQWVEITEGHFVYGNEPELEKYRAEIEAINAAERA